MISSICWRVSLWKRPSPDLPFYINEECENEILIRQLCILPRTFPIIELLSSAYLKLNLEIHSMSHGQSLQALDLIADDVFAEINYSVKALDQYLRNTKDKSLLETASNHLNKLKGIFTLLEMKSAKQLLIEINFLMESLEKRSSKSHPKLLEIISTALLRLQRYLEHVGQKSFDIPELILPTINQLRSICRRRTLSESAFFSANVNSKRKSKGLVLLTSESSASESRHYRQMYQIGLIEVIRQTNISGGLKMMQTALMKLDERCPRPSSPNLWWIARVLLYSFIDDNLLLSKERLKLFSRIDRQIRNIENKSKSLYDNNKMEMDLLAKEMLYLSWISQSSNKFVKSLIQHFELEPAHISDANLRQEFVELSGPSAQDFNSLADAILHELESIEAGLAPARTESYQADDLEAALIQMISLNNMLKILQVDDQIIRLSMAIDLIEKSIDNKQPLPEKDVNILHVVIDNIRKSVSQSDLAKYSGKTASSRELLTEHQSEVRNITHTTVKKLINLISRFTVEGRKVLLLKQGDTFFSEIKSGFQQLRVTQALAIIDKSHSFFVNHLQKNPKGMSDEQINLFADVVASLEFYLDTMEFTANPSKRILAFAETSIEELFR